MHSSAVQAIGNGQVNFINTLASTLNSITAPRVAHSTSLSRQTISTVGHITHRLGHSKGISTIITLLRTSTSTTTSVKQSISIMCANRDRTVGRNAATNNTPVCRTNDFKQGVTIRSLVVANTKHHTAIQITSISLNGNADRATISNILNISKLGTRPTRTT